MRRRELTRGRSPQERAEAGPENPKSKDRATDEAEGKASQERKSGGRIAVDRAGESGREGSKQSRTVKHSSQIQHKPLRLECAIEFTVSDHILPFALA